MSYEKKNTENELWNIYPVSIKFLMTTFAFLFFSFLFFFFFW